MRRAQAKEVEIKKEEKKRKYKMADKAEAGGVTIQIKCRGEQNELQKDCSSNDGQDARRWRG